MYPRFGLAALSPRVLARKESAFGRKRSAAIPDPDFGWFLLGAVGAVFVVAGFVDMALAWIPPQLGNPEWEFGTISASLDALPLPTMGLGFLMASAVASGRSVIAKTVAITFGILAVVVAGWGILYLLDVPVALGAVPDGPLRTGLLKGIAKGLTLAAVYPLAFGWLAWKGLRRRAAPTA